MAAFVADLGLEVMVWSCKMAQRRMLLDWRTPLTNRAGLSEITNPHFARTNIGRGGRANR